MAPPSRCCIATSIEIPGARFIVAVRKFGAVHQSEVVVRFSLRNWFESITGRYTALTGGCASRLRQKVHQQSAASSDPLDLVQRGNASTTTCASKSHLIGQTVAVTVEAAIVSRRESRLVSPSQAVRETLQDLGAIVIHGQAYTGDAEECNSNALPLNRWGLSCLRR
jgi:hypothetical protein